MVSIYGYFCTRQQNRVTVQMPPLTQKSIHLWHFSIPSDFSDNSFLTTVLSNDEIQRGEQFAFTKDRAMFFFSRGVLRHLLSRYTAIPPDKIKFHYNPFGKPSLSNSIFPFAVVFNLSHTADAIVLAFAGNRNLGIDIEKINLFSEWEDIANAFFLEEEKEYLYRLQPAKQLHGFFQIWTKKEALLKALGFGLGMGLEMLPKVPLIGEEASVCITDHSSLTWTVRALDLPQGYAGAIAYQEGSVEVFGSSHSSFINTIPALPIGLVSPP